MRQYIKNALTPRPGITNEHFAVGERYIGMINSASFRVKEIKKPGDYTTASGGVYTLSQTYVVFVSEKDGREYEVDLETAKRLLLQKINH